MSNIPGGRGVSTAHVVVFVVLILISGVVAYVFYSEADRLETEAASERVSLDSNRKVLAKAKTELADYKKTLGFTTEKQINAVFDQSSVTVDPRKLETLVTTLQAEIKTVVDDIGVDPKDVDVEETVAADGTTSYRSKFIDETLIPMYEAASVPADKQGTKIGKLVAEKIRRREAQASQKSARDQGIRDVDAVVAKISNKDIERKSKLAQWDKRIAAARKIEVEKNDKLRLEPVKWNAEKEQLTAKLDSEKATNTRLEEKRKVQIDPTSPVDGRVISYDWKLRRGTVDLGARDRIKAGYVFEIFVLRPGPEGPEKREFRGRMRLLNVGPETSLFTMIPSPWEDASRPIMPGNLVRSKLYDRTDRKIFVLKGWFPKGGDHAKNALAGLIFKNGGVVEDELTRRTDYLVIGMFDEKDVPEPSAEAKAALAEGKAAHDWVKHHGTASILSVRKLLKYLERSGMKAAP